jgi:hypothetical protein
MGGVKYLKAQNHQQTSQWRAVSSQHVSSWMRMIVTIESSPVVGLANAWQKVHQQKQPKHQQPNPKEEKEKNHTQLQMESTDEQQQLYCSMQIQPGKDKNTNQPRNYNKNNAKSILHYDDIFQSNHQFVDGKHYS